MVAPRKRGGVVVDVLVASGATTLTNTAFCLATVGTS